MRKKRKKNLRNREIPLSWRILQASGCTLASVLLFAVIYSKFFIELAASVGGAPDPVERVVFSAGFAVFFSILIAFYSNLIMQRIIKKQSMADIAENITREVAAEALNAVVDGIAGSISGGSVKGSSGTEGGGGSSGGGGASGNY